MNDDILMIKVKITVITVMSYYVHGEYMVINKVRRRIVNYILI